MKRSNNCPLVISDDAGKEYNEYASDFCMMLAKPVPIKQWTGENTDEMVAFIKRHTNESLIVDVSFNINGASKSKLSVFYCNSRCAVSIEINDYIFIDKIRDEMSQISPESFAKEFAHIDLTK